MTWLGRLLESADFFARCERCGGAEGWADEKLSSAAEAGPFSGMLGTVETVPFQINDRDSRVMKNCNSSMQLTRAADYGVRVMVHLATLPEHERALLPELAEATEAPESFLSKVLQALARAELIRSWRGKAGGFVILPRGRSASMLEVIEAIDGPICLNVCLLPGQPCSRMVSCPAHPVWARALRALLDVLRGTGIAELASRERGKESTESTAPSAVSLNAIRF